MTRPRIRTIGDFARYLESVGELHRVAVEVDPYLEVTEIATRAIREKRPAILFEKVKGSRFPILMNTMASDLRCELALNGHPEQLGEELIRFLGDVLPPSPKAVLRHSRLARRFLSAPVRRIRKGLSQEVRVAPDLESLPVLTCWPEDGGRFITLPQVITYDPRTGKRNMGMYRMQVFDGRTTGMHWQIQKGGASITTRPSGWAGRSNLRSRSEPTPHCSWRRSRRSPKTLTRQCLRASCGGSGPGSCAGHARRSRCRRMRNSSSRASCRRWNAAWRAPSATTSAITPPRPNSRSST